MKYQDKIVKEYWNRYIGGLEEIPDHLDYLDDVILASWKRSKAKVNPFELRPSYLSKDELKKLHNDNKQLISVSYPYMIKFYEIAKSTTQRVLLTDSKGYQLLNISSKNKNLEYLMNNAYVNDGMDFSEDASGTSSVGLSLITNKPILLMGYEHYRAIYHNLACVAAPIHTLGGDIIGSICITGSLKKYQSFIMNALIMMIQAIENELRLTQSNYLRDIIVSHFNQGFMLINSHRQILEYNENTKITLAIDDDLKGHFFNDYFINSFSEIIKCKHNSNIILIKKNKIQIPIYLSTTIINENNQDDLYLLIFSSQKENQKITSDLIGFKASYTFNDIIGKSKALSKAISLSKISSANNSNILIQGESGTGKELFAQAIHNASVRHNYPFITIHCASIPSSLIMKELFGDSRTFQASKIELADNGTIFLDEIESLPIECQNALYEFCSTGQLNNKQVSVKIIAATTKDLYHLTYTNNFKLELFYKLNVITINIPPLRQRKEDISKLISHYINKYNMQFKRDLKNIEKNALEVLINYSWPGNVRELENVIERLANVTNGTIIKFHDLPEELITSYMLQKYTNSVEESIPETKETIEYKMIIKGLSQTHGNIKALVPILGMPLSTIYRKIDKYQINIKEYRKW